MSLLPSRGPETSTRQEGEFEVVGVDEDVAPVLDALASDTAREVLNAIYENPGTPSEIAGRLDMSIQKVAYHLEKLEDVDLIDVAGTRYSEKGQEMTVYEPPDDPLVLFVGTRERKNRLRSLVRRVIPSVTILALAGLLVQGLFGGSGSLLPFLGDGSSGDGGEEVALSNQGGASGGSGDDTGTAQGAADAATSTPQATDGDGMEVMEAPTPEPTSYDVATDGGNASGIDAVRAATETADPGLEPGLAFFVGGVFALTLVGTWLYYRSRGR